MICPKCKTEMVIDLKITGGCSGHEPEEYCYCDSPDVRAAYHCPQTSQFTKRGRCLCRQRNVQIHALSDQYGIARWLTEHYSEAPAR